jgi:ubiquitin C-terminal hydrolase
LQLPIADRDEIVALSSCVNDYLMGDVLERVKCPSCKSRDTIARKMAQRRGPDVLAIQLKRMKASVNSFHADGRAAGADLRKLHTPVAIPLELSFGGREYLLKSVLLHHGARMNAGHYTTLGTQRQTAVVCRALAQ